ncbi:hypothetical protein [Wenzhouxiangella marina]|uniref:Uncharacterized protein n=1 Tax=Wenzhouxiangella marina TaxID=1579979 RepID=A0A0K0XYJ7_9GAMM|nr:hypothetical protein [Wenzhouxiangella marina]AKS42697.1 hypothetical protein WM2015_2334 [Wenzhouxiangella marina]MBB6088614.1 hypothetical protein [Wenzhouxiangella marina]
MRILHVACLTMTVAFSGLTHGADALPLDWEAIVNNGDEAPGGDANDLFRSYNPPSMNDQGVVVFRARSAILGGPQSGGLYMIDLGSVDPAIKLLFRGDPVPAPNNLGATFIEFPSTPRIDPNGSLVASRGQHDPVWEYSLGGKETTRVGTAGIYAFPTVGDPAVTGASLLGAAVEPDQITLSFPWFSVPATVSGTRFDQFPGATAVDGDYIIFKGNYTDLTDGLGRTGIYFRDVVSTSPTPYTGMIASSNLEIPGSGGVLFGATAPPSAANGSVYFTGWDIEEAPTIGGIFKAPIAHLPTLENVVAIGDPVPDAPGETFANFGEGISVSSDGSMIAFWGTWGAATFSKLLECPIDGNPALIAFCNEQHPDGLLVDIPINQGIFLHDTGSGTTSMISRTGQESIEDYLFWVFSGRVPGTGDEETDEPARWRSSAYAALSTAIDQPARVAFQAQRSGRAGIYLRDGVDPFNPLKTVAEVGTTLGQAVDPDAPVDSFVSSVAMERDGFRNGRLAIALGMLYIDPVDPEETASWAGIYSAVIPLDNIFADRFEQQP